MLRNYRKISPFRKEEENSNWREGVEAFAQDVEKTIHEKKALDSFRTTKGRDMTPPTASVRESWRPFTME